MINKVSKSYQIGKLIGELLGLLLLILGIVKLIEIVLMVF